MRTICLLIAALLLNRPTTTLSQAVLVTAVLDTNQLSVGQTTTLRVYAQVIGSLQPNADRIFSWYVDILNTNAAVATANYAALMKPASDNFPQISSPGFTEGPNRRAIYDTFMEFPNAGVLEPVQLLFVPVLALSPGVTRFAITSGTGAPGLSSDFLVAPLGGGEAWSGGDYTSAIADLQVAAPSCQPQLQITQLGGNRLQLAFPPCPGVDNHIETTAALTPTPLWETLPGGPYNSGTAFVSNTLAHAFFRVRLKAPTSSIQLQIVPLTGNQLRISFTPVNNYDHYLEFAPAISNQTAWQPVPGGPVNSGVTTVSNAVSQGFYRLRLQAH